MAAFFLGCNRNKRSLVLDLKLEAGRQAMAKLAARADVLVHNYRPGAHVAASHLFGAAAHHQCGAAG
jgi:crotonobetainyl-CoA:carnitine CoA-transferase CaiB-like acyl-CoA transferase